MIAEALPFVDAVRLFVISLGSFLTGFALFVGYLYGRGEFHSGIYGRGRHVAAIVLSYSLLTAGGVAEFVRAQLDGRPVGWHTYLALFAYAFGIYALVSLVATRARNPRRGGDTHDRTEH